MLPHLLFDFGGVIIDIDYDGTPAAMRRLSRSGHATEYSRPSKPGCSTSLKPDSSRPAEFRDGLRTAYDLEASDDELDAAWYAMLLEVPAERLAYLASCGAQGYQTALLSNTNALHIAEINRRLAAQYGFTHGIADCLDRVFYSQEVGCASRARRYSGTRCAK